MPYKASGKRVMVKRGGKWVTLKTHKTEGQAKAHAAALNANVSHKK
jgi:hypothetical protein